MTRKIMIVLLAVLSVIFLVISILSWNVYLGTCAFVIAISLTRFLDTEPKTRRTSYAVKEANQ